GVAVQVLDARTGPGHRLLYARPEGCVGAEHHGQRADAAVVAVGGGRVDLGGRGAERGQDGRGGDVVVVVGLGAEQVVVRRVAGGPGQGPRRGRGQAIAHIPPVEAHVFLAAVASPGAAGRAPFP